jgi:hypothetical protein
MAVAIRGTTPASTITVSNPVSLTLTGSQQPQSGDVLLIVHANDFYALSNMPTPTVGGSSTGVTAVTNGSADGGSNGAHAIAYTFNVGSTGDLTVAVTETGSADEEKALVVYVLSGVDTGTPVDVAGNATNTGATTHICPSVSPTSSDAYLICHTNPGGGAAPASYTHPSGMTETLDTVSGGLALGGAILQLSASGATGSKTFTPSNSVTASANLSIAVKTGGAAVAESSAYSPARLPGRIGPDGDIFLPKPRFDAGTVSVDANAAAGLADGAGSALQPIASVAPNAGSPAGAGSALTAVVSVRALAGVASSSGTALAPAGGIGALAGSPTAAGEAPQPTVTTGGASTNAPAGLAAATGTAFAPTASVGVRPAAPTGAGTAFADTASVGAQPAAPVAAGSAPQPTVSTSSSTNAPAGLASATGTAFAPRIAVAPTAGVASGAGAANQPAALVRPNAGVAAGAGSALQPTVLTGRLAFAGLASATGTAGAPTIRVAAVAGVAAATGSALQPIGLAGERITPDSRIHYVPAYPRTRSIDTDDRTSTIDADARTFTVPAE